jgi:TonB-dependent starch-binding outer membrane protein SusC
MKKLPQPGVIFSTGKKLRKAIPLCFKLTSTFLIFILCLFHASAGLSYQDGHQVSGTVTDISGESLPGVNVLIDGTMIGTITGPDGEFTITAPDPNSSLVISYIGYARQVIPIQGRAVVDVVMSPEFRAIDEIVVVGYGTRLREELTGSVSTVSSERMTISTQPSAIGRMQGQVSGVTITSPNTPSGSATVRVRGLGTINDNEPLYIIDGVPAGPGNNINPNDIESISVLKDASSAAIYGTRGANGVILITTKRGRQGERATVNFMARSGVSQAVNQYDLLNTQEYGELLWLEAANRGVAPNNPLYGTGSEPVIPDYILPAGASEGDPGADPALYDYPSYLIQRANRAGTNWYDEIYQSGLMQEYDLSVSGGGENVTYAFSGGYLNEQGTLIHTGFERYTFRNTTDASFADWFRAGQTLNASFTNSHGNQNSAGEGIPISNAYRTQPIVPVYDIMGNYAGSRAPSLGNSANPVAQLERAQHDYGRNFRLLGNFFGEATIIEGLNFNSLFGYNLNQGNGIWRSLRNPEHSEPQSLDHLNQWSNYSIQWNWANTLNFASTFADIHRVNVVLGTEAIENIYQWQEAARSQYFSTNVNYMQLSAGEVNMTNAGSGSEWSLFSIFGRVNYDLMGRYLFEATVRRDGSSRFGPENRYATFPAASVAWAVSQEDFMAGTRGWLDFLKLRLGWGISGNDRIGNYNIFTTYGTNPSLSAYDLGGTNTSRIQGFQPAVTGNPNVTWETTESVNFGIDATVFSNVTMALDIWERNTTDMLYQLRVPNVAGLATPPFLNIGSMRNRGFDVELGYANTARGGELRYGASLNVSRYVNEITKLSEDVEEEIVTGSLRQMDYSRAAVGTAFPEFYGYIVDGIFQTQAEADAHAEFGDYNQPGRFMFRDLNDDGVIDANDRTYIGSPHPDFTGGLNLDLGFGGFDMNAFFYFSYGNDMINYVRRWIDYTQFLGNRSTDRLYRSWGSPYLADNRDAVLPIADLDDRSQLPSTHFVEDGSFLRLKSLRLGYTVPQNVLNRLQMQNLRLYIQGTNLWTLTNYSGLDPEYHRPGDQGFYGIDQGAWPTARQIMIGLQVGI